MKPDDIKRLYDRDYAASYDETFLTAELTWPDVEHEVELLRSLAPRDGTWLDVACGTGYFFNKFPGIARHGLDLSPAMLDVARAANPGVPFTEGDYLEPRAEWNGRFDLVTCMWYAYCLVETVPDVLRLVGNLAAWTSGRGCCFMPLADPALITGYPLPYRLESGGNAGAMTLSGILWTYSESDGTKVHRNMITPHPDLLVETFRTHFDRVELVRYPPRFPGWTGRPAIVARDKRATA